MKKFGIYKNVFYLCCVVKRTAKTKVLQLNKCVMKRYELKARENGKTIFKSIVFAPTKESAINAVFSAGLLVYHLNLEIVVKQINA